MLLIMGMPFEESLDDWIQQARGWPEVDVHSSHDLSSAFYSISSRPEVVTALHNNLRLPAKQACKETS